MDRDSELLQSITARAIQIADERDIACKHDQKCKGNGWIDWRSRQWEVMTWAQQRWLRTPCKVTHN